MSEPLTPTETATCHCAKPIGDCDCIEARVHAAEMTAGFNLRWKADMRAIKRWQAATGRDLVWPDHADLVVWLLEQLDAGPIPPPNAGAGLREAAQAVVKAAEPDDDFDGQFIDYLVPFAAIDALRAALGGAE